MNKDQTQRYVLFTRHFSLLTGELTGKTTNFAKNFPHPPENPRTSSDLRRES
jgi:hypothetical protein